MCCAPDIGLPSHKSLFQLQAERIKSLKRLAAAAAGVGKHTPALDSTAARPHARLSLTHMSARTTAEEKVVFPWYVMTSPQTDVETRKFFADHSNWGIALGDVMFFEQANLPCLTYAGKIILETTHTVSQAPNGHGGVYRALKASGCLEDINRRGVQYAHVYGVDNALVKVGDPAFLAFCVEQSMLLLQSALLRPPSSPARVVLPPYQCSRSSLQMRIAATKWC